MLPSPATALILFSSGCFMHAYCKGTNLRQPSVSRWTLGIYTQEAPHPQKNQVIFLPRVIDSTNPARMMTRDPCYPHEPDPVPDSASASESQEGYRLALSALSVSKPRLVNVPHARCQLDLSGNLLKTGTFSKSIR
ncbi:hypothetical protein B0H17DRAFT_1176571 [Mycena rosella]|uniref:Uncharacterized protein n=1 Tax=Mycena rosella TaxID=1033263 RepID=A0AAD7DX98_MYCRO|nr:hypothetical protein B0H17DRAFT_1176571 [Mycena rosella]